jgi:hypothetical protein
VAYIFVFGYSGDYYYYYYYYYYYIPIQCPPDNPDPASTDYINSVCHWGLLPLSYTRVAAIIKKLIANRDHIYMQTLYDHTYRSPQVWCLTKNPSLKCKNGSTQRVVFLNSEISGGYSTAKIWLNQIIETQPKNSTIQSKLILVSGRRPVSMFNSTANCFRFQESLGSPRFFILT